MSTLDYQLNPVLMGGVVTDVKAGDIKINLNGRLGVLHVTPDLLVPQSNVALGDKVKFYFSYMQTVENPLDYDYYPLRHEADMSPCLIGGVLDEVNDTAVRVTMGDHLGTIAVPRRWVFTNVALAAGQEAEFYVSRISIS